MKTIKVSNASRPLTEYAAELGNEVLVLTQGNRPVAAIVPLKGVDRESLALSSHPEFLDLIARSRAQIQRGETLTLDEIKSHFGIERSPNKRLQPTTAPRKRRRARKEGSRRVRG